MTRAGYTDAPMTDEPRMIGSSACSLEPGSALPAERAPKAAA